MIVVSLDSLLRVIGGKLFKGLNGKNSPPFQKYAGNGPVFCHPMDGPSTDRKQGCRLFDSHGDPVQGV